MKTTITTTKKMFMNKIYTKLLIGLLFVLGTVGANAQLITNYTFATNATGSLALDMNSNAIDMSTGTTTLIGASSITGAGSGLVNIGFDMLTMGTRNTQFSVSANGWLGIGVALTGSGNGWLGGGVAGAPRVAPFLVNSSALGINFAMGTSSTGKVHSKIVGTSPNRTLVIEYLNMQINSTLTGGSADATFQARIYEATGVMEFVYGTMSVGTGSSTVFGQVGWSNTSTIYSSVNTATHVATVGTTTTQNLTAGTITDVSSVSNGSRRVYRYTPIPLTAPTWQAPTLVTATTYSLNWTDNSTGELGFEIYRATDGINYTFQTRTAANAVTFAATSLLPGTTYQWRITAVLEGPSVAATGSQATSAAGTKTSTGTGNWSVAGTWSPSGVPTAGDNVTIADGHTVTIDVTPAVCNDLTVGAGGAAAILQYDGTSVAKTLTVGNNVVVALNGTIRSNTVSPGSVTNHILSVTGDFTVNGAGTVNGSASTNSKMNITFTNAINKTFTTSATSSITINTVTVNKGTSSASILDFNPGANWTATAGSQGFAITNGTLRIGGSATVANVVFNATGYSIPSTGGFWLNNPNFTVSGQGSSPTMSGLLRMTAGIYNVGTAAGNSMSGATTSSFIIEGGTMNFASRLLVTSASALFNMSAGIININTVGNISSASPCFGFTSATSSFTMSGGTINLVQATTTGATLQDYQVSSIVNITGGTLNVGTAATATNFNFRIQGATPNIVIDNAGIAKTATLTAQTNVYGNLTINTGASLNHNATTGFLLLMLGNATNQGNVVNNGSIVGTAASSRFDFQGSAAQNYSGTGTFGTVGTPFVGIGLGISNVNNVTLNSPVITTRVNLFYGQFINSNQITLGNAALSCFVQRGGNASFAAGSFDVAPNFSLLTNQIGYSYSTASAAVTTGVEIPLSRDIGSVTINNVNGVTLAGGNLNMIAGTTPTLTMTIGNFNIGANNLTLGLSATTPGVLTYTAGNIVTTTGTFTRWFPASGLPTTASTGIGHFPMASGANNRRVQLFFNATTINAGGTVRVAHTNVNGLTTIAGFVDGAITVDTRSNSNWDMSTANGFDLGATTASLAVRADNVAAIATVADIRLIRATDAVGVTAVGTGTSGNPVLNRTGLATADLTNTFYLGSAAANLSQVFTAIATGNWGENSTWDLGSTPGPNDDVIIPSSFNVTVAGSITPYNGNNLTISAGGTLTAAANSLAITGNITNNGTMLVSGGTVNIGITDNSFCNRTLTVNGTLTVSAGNLNVYGNFVSNIGSVFTHSGGNIAVDGNAGGVAANSVPTGTDIVRFNTTVLANLSLSGGTFTIVDPHADATANLSLGFNTGTTGTVTATTGHTFRFGNGASTDAGGNVLGFNVDPWIGTGGLKFGNFILDAVSGTNREYTISSQYVPLIVGGNLTITSGEIIQNSTFSTGIISVTGNVVNAGTLTVAGTVGGINFNNTTYSSGTALSSSAATTAQTVSGGGTFRNATAGPTASATFMTVNNNSAGGLTLSTGSNLSLSGGLTMTNGIINTNSSNVLTLNSTIATTPSGSATAYVNGPLGIVVNSAVNLNKTFAIGQGLNWRPVVLGNFHSNGAAQTYIAEVINGATGGTANAPLISLNSTRYFRIQNTSNIFSTLTATVQLSYGVDDVSIVPTGSAKVAQSATSGGTYTSIGGATSGAPTTGIVSSTLITSGEQYFVIGNEDNPPITWVGGSGNWSTAANWSCACVPIATDNVSIAPGAASTITVDGNFAVKDIAIGTNATINLGVNTLTVNRDYSQTAGTIDLGTGTLDLIRNFTRTAGTFTASTGLLSLTGTAGQTFSSTSGITLNNLTLTNGGGDKTFTSGQTITIGNNLSVGPLVSMNLSSASATTFNVGGNLIYSPVAAGANIGSLTMNLTNTGGSATVSSASVALVTPNITIASTGIYALASNFEISTGRTFTTTGVLNAETFALSGAGAYTVGSSGRLGISSATADVNTSIAVSGTKTFTAGCIISYNAAGNQTIVAASHPTGGMIYTSGGGTKMLNGNVTISGTSGSATAKGSLYVNSGTVFADGGFTITMTSTGYNNLVVEGSYLSTGSGAISFESGPTFSKIRAIDGTLFGDLKINFASSTSSVSLESHPNPATVNITFRNILFGGGAGAGVGGGTLVLNSLTSNVTNVIVTGDVNINPATASNTGGGFGGTASTTGTVQVNGNISSTSTSTSQQIFNSTGTANTLIFGGSAAQTYTVGANTSLPTNLTTRVNNAAGVTFGDGTTKTFTIAGTMDIRSGVLTVTGTSTLAYLSGALLTYTGTSAQTTGGAFLTSMIAGVTVNINNAAGVNLNANRTINGTLSFTTGNLITGANTMIMSSTGTVSGAAQGTGWVAGNLQKNVATGASVSRTFEIGGATTYRPATVLFASVSTAGNLVATVSQSAGNHPQIANSGLDAAKSVTRFWTLTNSGIVFTTYSSTFNFVAGDVPGGAITANFIIRKYDAPNWSTTTLGSANALNTSATGLTSFSDFAIGESTGTPAVSTQPADALICDAGTATFTAASTSVPAPAIQWQEKIPAGSFTNITNGGIYSGATTGTLTLTGATLSMSLNEYRAVFTNINGNVNSDPIVLTVNSPATAAAGSNQTVCAGNTITLAGSIGGAASNGTWSGGAGTYTPNATTLNAVYTPTAGEITAGSVTLTLTTDNPTGPCLAVSSNMTITISASSGSLASIFSCKNMDVGTGATYTDASCNTIAKVLPSGGSPVTGIINACVTLDGSQQFFLSEPYVQRHYDVEPVTNPTTSTATIVLYFDDAEFVTYNTNNPAWPALPTLATGGANIANLKVTQFHGTPAGGLPTATPANYTGTKVLLTPVSVVLNGTIWEVTVDVTGFSGFYVHTKLTNTPLPITINYFTGQKQGSNHLLNWKVTCNNTSKATMTLERSADGRNYSGINTIVADAARCNQPFNYSDANPLKGMNYYRLKMLDDNGKVTYSSIVALLNAAKGFEIVSIAPNPVVGDQLNLNIASSKSEKIDLQLYDMQGRMISRHTISVIAGFSSIKLNVAQLAAGTYSLRGLSGNDEQIKMIRFVKQ